MKVVIDIPDKIYGLLKCFEEAMSTGKKYEELTILHNDCPLAERSEADASCD